MSHPMVTIRHQSRSDSDVVPRIYTMYLEASNNNVSCSLLPPSLKQLQLSLHSSPPLSPLSIKVRVEYCVVYRIYYAPAQQNDLWTFGGSDQTPGLGAEVAEVVETVAVDEILTYRVN